MRTFNEFIAESKQDDTYFASLDIENTEKLYQIAMRAKSAADLEKSMAKLKAQFPDAKQIDFKKVDWDSVYADLNEAEVEKTDTEMVIEAILADKKES